MNKYAHLAPPTPDVTRRRCATKIRFRAPEAAERAAAKLGARRGVALFPYHCPLCLGWHTTKRAPGA